MILVKGQLGLELARHDRVDQLASDDDRRRRVAAFLRLLPASDRRLLELVVIRGVTHRVAAEEFGVAAGMITRRVMRLRAMLASPTLRALAEHIDTLAQPARQLAISHFFARTSVSDIARDLGQTRRCVQSQLDYIRGWARALHRQSTVGERAE